MSAHRRLLEAVLDLDSVNYPRMYETSAEFHATIDTLVRVLVPITRMIADDAIRNTQERDAAVAALAGMGIDTVDRRDPDWMKGVADSLRFPPGWQEEARGPAPGWKPEPRQ